MVYTGDRRAGKPNRSWWNKPEINGEAVTSLAAGTRGRGDMTGALGDQAYLAGDGASEKTQLLGAKMNYLVFFHFLTFYSALSHLTLDPARCQLTREPRKEGKAKKRGGGLERQMSQTATSSSCFAYTSFLLTSEYVFGHLSFLLINLGKKVSFIFSKRAETAINCN